VVAFDNSLDLSGGTARYTYWLDSPSNPFQMDNIHAVEVRHNIDFSKKGTYIVTLYKNEDVSTTFEIQVVTQEEYDAMMAQEE
jgi:hypothetical protein